LDGAVGQVEEFGGDVAFPEGGEAFVAKDAGEGGEGGDARAEGSWSWGGQGVGEGVVLQL